MDIFQISHTAANMAMVMGMGKGNRYTSLEVRRLWLACYHICSSASMALRIPNIMRWTRHIDECLDALSVSDQVLCAQVRLQYILEECEAQLSSTPSVTAVNVTHRVAKRQLAEWASVAHIWNGTSIPSLPEDGRTSINISKSEFTESLTAAHVLLDTFLSLDMSLIRALPTSYSVQITHTAIVLVKLHFASRGFRDHGDLDLKADDYLGRLVKKFSGWGALWPAQKLSYTLRRLHRMLRQCGNQGFASELSWLNVWTLAEPSRGNFAGQVGGTTNHSGTVREELPISQGLDSTVRATLSAFDEELLAWSMSGTGQCNVIEDLAQTALPSASLDASQLIDWFGTDLDTSTFDFDGNLQSMIQIFD
ncbi:hypothetical protein KCU62_g4039, partial [Aureobasidium sp. EXF-3399]